MLRSVESILGYQVSSRNGIAGTVTDILFANNLRSVRGLAVLTGGWMDRREVLVSAERVIELNPAKMEISVDLTREEICAARSLEIGIASRCPLDRLLQANHYGWFSLCLPDPLPGMAIANQIGRKGRDESDGSLHLYRFSELTACATDMVGSEKLILDAIVCDVDWSVAGLVVSAGDERFEAASLISAEDIQGACWEDRLVHVRKECRLAPHGATSPVNSRRPLRYFDYRVQFRDTVMATESQRSGCACSER